MNAGEIVDQIINGYRERKLETVMSLMAENIRYRIVGTAEFSPYAGIVQGRSEMQELLIRIGTDWDLKAFNRADMISNGNRVATQSEFHYQRRGSDFHLHSHVAHFWTLEAGMVRELVEYHDTASISFAA